MLPAIIRSGRPLPLLNPNVLYRSQGKSTALSTRSTTLVIASYNF